MMTKTLALSAAGALCVCVGAASGQISPVGPFTGPVTETFDDGPQTIFLPCIPQRIFNNMADMCTPGSSGTHTTSGWSFMCTIFPHNGSRFYGSAGGVTRITFDDNVSEFGGYFGTNCGTDGGLATFYDASMNVIGTAMITTAGCTWTWNGWESTTPVKAIDLASNAFGGAFLDMDDLEFMRGGNPPPSCYANCDNSTAVPFLNVNDFICFQGRFAAGDSYANCDNSTQVPVLNVNDFICFQSQFAAGCSAP